MKGGKLIEHEEVIAALERETISYSNNVGFGSHSNFSCGAFCTLVTAELKMEVHWSKCN